MAKSVKDKVTVSVDSRLLGWADELVEQGVYESRSAAMEAALEALHRERMDEQLVAALGFVKVDDALGGIELAEQGVTEWATELDAIDGGWPKGDAHAAG